GISAPGGIFARTKTPGREWQGRPVIAVKAVIVGPQLEWPIVFVITATMDVAFCTRDDPKLRIIDPARRIPLEVLGESTPGAGRCRSAGIRIDRQSNELTHGFARRAVQCRPGGVQLPDCLHDRLEHRQRHFRSGLAAPKGAASAVAVVVADPDGECDVLCATVDT